MTISNRAIAQGDILIIPVAAVPAGAKRAEVFEAADDAFVLWIKTLDDGAEIVHRRDFDTHAPAELAPNRVYQVRRQRESVPEGFRRAAD